MTAPSNTSSIQPTERANLRIKLTKKQLKIDADPKTAGVVPALCATFAASALPLALCWAQNRYHLHWWPVIALDLIATTAIVLCVLIGTKHWKK
jgi:hypothetical protein